MTNGIRTNKGATAKSCNNNIEVAACPDGSSSHSRSLRTGKTNADVESVPAKANTSASTGDEISINPASKGKNRSSAGATKTMPALSAPAHKEIWASPRGKKSANRRNRDDDTSNPSLKRRNKIPKSPNSTSALLLAKTSNPCGPNNAPAMRNPKMGEMAMALLSGTTTTDAARKRSKSCPIVSKTMPVAKSSMGDAMSASSAEPMSNSLNKDREKSEKGSLPTASGTISPRSGRAKEAMEKEWRTVSILLVISISGSGVNWRGVDNSNGGVGGFGVG
mmetsp:Transcript_51726/g.77363  ORF Transcript_51726/g.77363 Transcript_51726/m.77363 type:complete len:278 (-) Transcript_51726:177-1010(-)